MKASAMLIIFGGLPAAGKTTIARALAKAIGAMHVRVDTIEQNIRASGAPRSDVGPAGYMVAYAIAEDNLTLGHTVIADSVNSIAITRNAWLSVAERAAVPAIEIEVICSDQTEHRRRAETRPTDVPGLIKPSWAEITSRPYEDWSPRPLVIDTALTSPDDLVAGLVAKLGLGRATGEQMSVEWKTLRADLPEEVRARLYAKREERGKDLAEIPKDAC